MCALLSVCQPSIESYIVLGVSSLLLNCEVVVTVRVHVHVHATVMLCAHAPRSIVVAATPCAVVCDRLDFFIIRITVMLLLASFHGVLSESALICTVGLDGKVRVLS